MSQPMEPVTIGPVTVNPPTVAQEVTQPPETVLQPTPAPETPTPPTKLSQGSSGGLVNTKPEVLAYFLAAITVIGAVVLIAMNKTVPDALWGIAVGATGGGLGISKGA